MERPSMHCTTDVETFERQTEKALWDGLIDASGVPSIHLSWDAVCAALASTRFVRAAWWLDGEGVLVGLAICEDSEAISQGIDDFLEGTALFGWAKSFLHRQGGFRFGVRAIGTPLASGPHGYRFVEGLDALPLIEPLFDMPGAGGGNPPKTRVIKDRASVQGWADGVRLSGQSSWKAGWVDLEFDPVMRVDLAGKPTWDAYLSAMRTKARTKVKRILSLSSSLDIVALDQAGIESQAAKLHELYMLVYGRAAFRLGCLTPDDLIQLKRHMRDRFQVWECRLDGALVGFSAACVTAAKWRRFLWGSSLNTTRPMRCTNGCCWNSCNGASGRGARWCIWAGPRWTSKHRWALSPPGLSSISEAQAPCGEGWHGGQRGQAHRSRRR